jgi:(p)ppGpp synthase/HD superfamily hydrolase
MSRWSPDSFAQAWNFATFYHQGQTYGGVTEGVQVDYLNHVGSVAAEVIWALPERPDLRGDLAVQCALLHDVVEDTRATLALVRATFGPAVADGVQALTKNKRLPTKAAQMADSLARIQAQGHEVWMVKLADRIANLYHPPFYWDNRRIEEYRREAMAIHAALHPASPALAARLWAKIERYQTFLRAE